MIWVLLALLVLAAVFPLFLEWQRAPVQSRRGATDEHYAVLSEGLTHYRWRGPKDGPVVVCIHGLTTPMIAFDEIAEGLAARGNRVLTYDLFGRGLSDRPKAHHSRGFFTTQLSQLLRDQGVTEPITLIGYSMGGSIATAYATENPDDMRRLVLLAPAGLYHNPGRLARWARALPVFGDWLMLAFGEPGLSKTAHAITPPRPKITEALERELDTRGYLPAVLSSHRGMLGERLDPEHRKLADGDIPITAIWGMADTVIPLFARDRLAALNRRAVNVNIPNAGHTLPFTHPKAVLDALGGDGPLA